MTEFYVKPGDTVSFAKTVGESDVYLFAGITGDFAVNHVNAHYMARSKYGRRIAHGALLIGFASTCSTLMIEKCHGTTGDETPVSLGYDKVRFLGPVYIGDTVTLTYTITEVDAVKRRSRSQIRAVNDKGELVGVAEHILAWVKDNGARGPEKIPGEKIPGEKIPGEKIPSEKIQ
jgi:3-hydroxybutyryl-CoA dehydratase